MNIHSLLNYLPQLASGLSITILLTFVSLSIGLILAIVFTLIIYTNFLNLKNIVKAFTFFIRGTPLFVQIFIIYYGSGQFAWLRESFLWHIFKDPFSCAIIALAINTSAYTSKLFYGAIQSIPQGEIEACKALGMSKILSLRKVTALRTFKLILPAYSNEAVIMLKSTSLVSAITLMDVTGVMNKIIAQTYEPVPLLLIVGGIYLLLNLLIIRGFRMAETYFSIT